MATNPILAELYRKDYSKVLENLFEQLINCTEDIVREWCLFLNEKHPEIWEYSDEKICFYITNFLVHRDIEPVD